MTSDASSRHLDDSWIEEDLLACFKESLPIRPITPDIPISSAELVEYRALLANLACEGDLATCGAPEGSEPPARASQSQSTIDRIILGDTRHPRRRPPSASERQMFCWPAEPASSSGKGSTQAALLSELLLSSSKSAMSTANAATTVKWERNRDEPVPLSLSPHLYGQLLSRFPRAQPDACLGAMQAVEDVVVSMTDVRHALLDEANQPGARVGSADWQDVLRWIEILWGENSELLQRCRARLEGIFGSTAAPGI